MIKEEIRLELPSLNLKCAKKEQGEKAYAIDLIKKAIDICDNNLTSKVSGNVLLEEIYFGKIYLELMNISKDKDWFWKVKSRELDILNQDKLIYEIFMDKTEEKVKNYEYYKLNYIERSMIFMELDCLDYRSKNFNEISSVHWKSIRNGFIILLFSIIKGIQNKVINKVLLKIREDGTLIDCVYSCGRPIILRSKFSPEEICEEMLFHKQWRGELYSLQNKLIKEKRDYTELCEALNLNLKIDGIEEKSPVNMDENYVNILDTGIALKHVGKFEEAKDAFIKAMRIDNTMPTAYYNLGKYYIY